VQARLQRLQNNYEDFGMRRTVEGVVIVHVSQLWKLLITDRRNTVILISCFSKLQELSTNCEAHLRCNNTDIVSVRETISDLESRMKRV
jgi:hypothetical protein